RLNCLGPEHYTSREASDECEIAEQRLQGPPPHPRQGEMRRAPERRPDTEARMLPRRQAVARAKPDRTARVAQERLPAVAAAAEHEARGPATRPLADVDAVARPRTRPVSLGVGRAHEIDVVPVKLVPLGLRLDNREGPEALFHRLASVA